MATDIEDQFVIDNVGNQTSVVNDEDKETVRKVFDDFLTKNGPKILESTDAVPSSSASVTPFDKFYKAMNYDVNLGPNYTNKKFKKKNTNISSQSIDSEKSVADKLAVESILAKSVVLQPDFEDLKSVPSQLVSEKCLKKQRKVEKEKSKGTKWFNMPATEVTDELKNDLQVLQMRSVLHPKHFYKKNDLKVLPKYFQVGKVLDCPRDFYNSRLTKKERKRTLVDELLADAEFQQYNKRKYTEVLVEKQKKHYKAHRQAKRLKKMKK